MLKIQTAYVIDIENVCETFGTHMSDYEFCEGAENGSYRAVDCSDGNLQELYEDMSWYAGKLGENRYYNRINNEIKLIEQLRAFGHRGDVLVHVHW